MPEEGLMWRARLCVALMLAVCLPGCGLGDVFSCHPTWEVRGLFDESQVSETGVAELHVGESVGLRIGTSATVLVMP